MSRRRTDLKGREDVWRGTHWLFTGSPLSEGVMDYFGSLLIYLYFSGLPTMSIGYLGNTT